MRKTAICHIYVQFPFTITLQTWKARIRRYATSATKDDFKVSTSTRVCSKHFLFSDFIEYISKKRKLKKVDKSDKEEIT